MLVSKYWNKYFKFTYRRNLFKLFLIQRPCEPLHKRGISSSCGRDVEKGKCCWSLSSHQIWHWLNPQMIWFRHQYIFFWHCMISQPLYKCPRSIQHHISAKPHLADKDLKKCTRTRLLDIRASWADNSVMKTVSN